jgi:hypothetical protein
MTNRPNSIPDTLIALSKTPLHDRLAIERAGLQLEKLLLQGSAENHQNTPEVEDTVRRDLHSIYESYETNLEEDFAKKALTSYAQLSDYRLYRRFSRLVRNECKLVHTTSGDRLLFVGSGPFPISAILFSAISGAQVDCHECSSTACRISKEILNKLGLSGRINIIHKTAQNASLPTLESPGDYTKYTIIIVGLLAQPKADILHRIRLSIEAHTRLIIRYSEGNRTFLYKGIDLEDPLYSELFELGEKHHAGPDDSVSSVVALPRL